MIVNAIGTNDSGPAIPKIRGHVGGRGHGERGEVAAWLLCVGAGPSQALYKTTVIRKITRRLRENCSQPLHNTALVPDAPNNDFSEAINVRLLLAEFLSRVP